jgi:hypothetical protein
MRLHIQYLLSTGDSDRARAACLKYLQTSLGYFYPESIEIVEQAEALAKQLGGQLERPKLSWKYAWIQMLFGWHRAKRGQQLLLRFRWSVERRWDKMLFRIAGQRPVGV